MKLYRIRFGEIEAKYPTSLNAQKYEMESEILLDIGTDTGQITRRIYLGSLKCPETVLINQKTHITTSHISLTLVEGKNNTHLGRHTIFDFGRDLTSKPKFLAYGQRNTPLFRLSYTVEIVKYQYSFLLNNLTCLKRQNNILPEKFYADVEFNYSSDNINAQPTNRYWLGHFQKHESSSAFSSHHFSFSTVSSFSIKYYASNLIFSDSLVNESIFEIIHNEEGNEFLIWTNSNDKTKKIIKFQNSKDVKSMTIENDGHCYNIKFTMLKEEIEIIKDEQVDTLDQYYQEKSNENLDDVHFHPLSEGNEVEILIDGLQTFGRYYHYMMQAEHTIDILGWELSLTFGLIYTKHQPSNSLFDKLQKKFTTGNWKNLSDILLDRASAGVKVRIMVWRHQFLSYLNRYLYLGEVTIEREIKKLQNEAENRGLKVIVYYTEFDLPNPNSKYSDPYKSSNDADIIFILVGNPKGVVSCHHEKLVLIDAEYNNRCVAFTGGFDIARGRFDQPLHLPPQSIWDLNSLLKEDEVQRYGGKAVQPFWGNFNWLWHDVQCFVRGNATKDLYYHFLQRWFHAFTNDNHTVKNLKYPKFDKIGKPMKDPEDSQIHKSTVQVIRAWPAVLDRHVLLDMFCSIINSAKEYLYFEHQWPFHNFVLTQCMCDALKRNPDLYVIMVAPIKTDLPKGFVGSMLDMSQDHIDEHLEIIFKTAPDRVGIYGLVRQDESLNSLKTIYIHSKLTIVDDKFVSIGSSNMDSLSFYKSSEINLNVYSSSIAIETKERVVREHLEYFNKQMSTNFKYIFEAFERVAKNNHESLLKTGKLVGRIVHLVPNDKLEFISNLVNYPSPFKKVLYKKFTRFN
eukprot:gene2887-4730_t